MAITGSFSVAANDVVACPLSLTNSASGQLTLTITANGASRGRFYSEVAGGIEPIYWEAENKFEATGFVSQINAILGALTFSSFGTIGSATYTVSCVTSTGQNVDTPGTLTMSVIAGGIATTPISWTSSAPASQIAFATATIPLNFPTFTGGSVSNYKLSLDYTYSSINHVYVANTQASVPSGTPISVKFGSTVLGSATSGGSLMSALVSSINSNTSNHRFIATLINDTKLRINYLAVDGTPTGMPTGNSYSVVNSSTGDLFAPVAASNPGNYYQPGDAMMAVSDIVIGGGRSQYNMTTGVWSIYCSKTALNSTVLPKLKLTPKLVNGRFVPGVLQYSITDGYQGTLVGQVNLTSDYFSLSARETIIQGDMQGVAHFDLVGGLEGVYNLSATVTSANLKLVPQAGGVLSNNGRTLTLSSSTRAGVAAAAAAIGLVGSSVSTLNDTLTVRVWASDRGYDKTVTTQIAFVDVPYPPTMSGVSSSYTWNQGSAYTFPTITVDDPDLGDTLTFTLTPSVIYGTFTSTGGGSWSSANGNYVVSGTKDVINNALTALKFTPSDGDAHPTFNVSIALRDANQTGPNQTFSMVCAETPIAHTMSAPTYVNYDTAVNKINTAQAMLGSVVVSDPNTNNTFSVSMQINLGDATFGTATGNMAADKRSVTYGPTTLQQINAMIQSATILVPVNTNTTTVISGGAKWSAVDVANNTTANSVYQGKIAFNRTHTNAGGQLEDDFVFNIQPQTVYYPSAGVTITVTDNLGVVVQKSVAIYPVGQTSYQAPPSTTTRTITLSWADDAGVFTFPVAAGITLQPQTTSTDATAFAKITRYQNVTGTPAQLSVYLKQITFKPNPYVTGNINLTVHGQVMQLVNTDATVNTSGYTDASISWIGLAGSSSGNAVSGNYPFAGPGFVSSGVGAAANPHGIRVISKSSNFRVQVNGFSSITWAGQIMNNAGNPHPDYAGQTYSNFTAMGNDSNNQPYWYELTRDNVKTANGTAMNTSFGSGTNGYNGEYVSYFEGVRMGGGIINIRILQGSSNTVVWSGQVYLAG